MTFKILLNIIQTNLEKILVGARIVFEELETVLREIELRI